MWAKVPLWENTGGVGNSWGKVVLIKHDKCQRKVKR